MAKKASKPKGSKSRFEKRDPYSVPKVRERDEDQEADNYGITAAGSSSSVDRDLKKHGGPIEGKAAKVHLGRPGRAAGGRTGKGKTIVNVIVGGGKGQQQPPQAVPVPVPAGGGQPPMPPPRPPMMPGGMPMNPPVGMAAPAGAMMPPQQQPVPPPMARASGGRIERVVKKYGSGSGEGRLEKIGKAP